MIANQPQLPEPQKPKRPSRKTHITARNQAAFLAAYAKCGLITHAARMAKVHRGCHQEWQQTDPTYAARFQAAQDEAIELLEAEMIRRATEGGSDLLLIFALKAMKPHMYRERQERFAAEKTETDEKTVYRMEFDRSG